MIKISVVTVVFNAVDTIEKTINSVLNQDYDNIEYVIIDGGSTDGTIEVINKYRNLIDVFVSEKDNGIYDAMNKGVRYTTGDVVAFLNSDDWYNDNIFHYINDFFETEKCDMMCGAFQNVIDGELATVEKPKPVDEKLRVFFPYCHQAIFSKRELFKTVGLFDLNYKLGADYDWVLRCYLAGASISVTDYLIAFFSKNGRSMGNFSKGLRECKEIAYTHDKHSNGGYSKKISEYYDPRIIFIDNLSELEKGQREKIRLNETFDVNQDYYVWGTGMWAYRAVKALMLVGVNISGYIDTYRSKEYIDNLPVYEPSEIDSQVRVVISAPDYFNEIYEAALKMGFRQDRLLKIFDLFEEI